jgi:serine/threonine protein kinase
LHILELLRKGALSLEIATQMNTSVAIVSRQIDNIINRFVQLSAVSQDVTMQSPRQYSDDWMQLYSDIPEDGRVFAEKYLLEKMLGSGGMGAVFKAKHLFMNRHVALKLMHPALTEDRVAMRNFQREAMAIANVNHPNIVAVYDFGISSNHEPFLVMEYIAGRNLEEVLKEEGRLSVPVAMKYAMQTCDALAAAHANGVLHCDLKPSNMLVSGVTPHEFIKIVDFGLAEIRPANPSAEAKITDKFFACGTPRYMSPEQCGGAQLDERSDIYSLGCILYEVLTGVNIFAGKSAMDTMARQFELAVPPMASVCATADVPGWLEQAVLSMLVKDADERPASMQAVKKMLTESPATV